MKKFLFSLAAALMGLPLLAADPTTILDTTQVDSTVTTLKTELTTWAGNLVPILAAIGGAFLAVWLLRLVWRLIKSFSRP